jgi:CRISPR system Cascade subunit CasD
MRALVMHLAAPMMSFGAVKVDNLNVIQPFPGLSMLVGLLANALGWHHRDVQALERLQDHLSFAAREDVPGHHLRDYQTADLGQEHLRSDRAWTTRGWLDERGGGGDNKTGTQIRLRDYWADAAYTVLVTLSGGEVTLEALVDALRHPARPLFLGRKCCLPSTPLLPPPPLPAILTADDWYQALRVAPRPRRCDPLEPAERLRAWWPAAPEDMNHPALRLVTDRRDWANQIHVGQRWMIEGTLTWSKELET